MNIVYRGNFGVDFSTESHIKASLESLGHTVNPIQENRVPWQQTIRACESADLFLWTSTYGYAQKFKHDEAASVQQLNSMLPTAAIHLDLFWGLKRETQVRDCGWFQLTHVFTADGDNDDRFKEAGVNHHWLMPAVYHAECVPGTYREEYASDVAFVGATAGYHAEWMPHRAALLNFLRQTYGERCRFWPKPGTPAVRGQDLNDLYASVKVVVGDSCFADRSTTYTSDRVFETVGRGGFLLYPRIPAVAKTLLSGVHLDYYEPGDLYGLAGLVHEYLGSDEVRESIQRAGQGFVREHHTYRNRLQEALKVMGLDDAE